MDYFETQEFFKQMHPDKKISYEFDDNCHRIYEVVMTDGHPHVMQHIEHRKVKVIIEGMNPNYVPITPHREAVTWSKIKESVNFKKDVFITPADLNKLSLLQQHKDNSNYQQTLNFFIEATGLTREEIEAKIVKFRNSNS